MPVDDYCPHGQLLSASVGGIRSSRDSIGTCDSCDSEISSYLDSMVAGIRDIAGGVL